MDWRLIAACLALSGCAISATTLEAMAVRDYVEVADLEEIDIARLYRQLKFGYVNDNFVIVVAGSRHFLIEFEIRCRSLRSKTFTAAMVDHRFDPSYLRPRDTIKGCPVYRIYKATPEQLREIKELSERIIEEQRAAEA